MQIDVVAKPAESAAVSVVFVGTNKKLAGPAVVVAQGLVLIVAIGLVLLARRASANGWNR